MKLLFLAALFFLLVFTETSVSQALDDKGNVEQDDEEDVVDEEETDQQEVTPVQLRCVLEIVNTGEDHGTV